jgi:hypothetical protein
MNSSAKALKRSSDTAGSVIERLRCMVPHAVV